MNLDSLLTSSVVADGCVDQFQAFLYEKETLHFISAVLGHFLTYFYNFIHSDVETV